MSSESKHAYKQGFWREHSDAWKTSGLTQVAYCAQQGISYQSFIYQHNRMASKALRRKRPRGTSLKLLNLVADKGLSVLS